MEDHSLILLQDFHLNLSLITQSYLGCVFILQLEHA